jgi:hypothetical protein
MKVGALQQKISWMPGDVDDDDDDDDDPNPNHVVCVKELVSL